MINKRNVLGKPPLDLGDKDAIHVAIVAVRAGEVIKPGDRVGFNEFNEAVQDDDGPGVADPFRKSIVRGDSFWMLLAQDEVPNVRHVWEHPSIKFDPPTRPVVENRYLKLIADGFGLTVAQLMDACSNYVHHSTKTPYRGPLTEEQLDEKWCDEKYDIWSEWADESGHEFENTGTACCPEYDYPYGMMFTFVGDTPQTALEARDRS